MRILVSRKHLLFQFQLPWMDTRVYNFAYNVDLPYRRYNFTTEVPESDIDLTWILYREKYFKAIRVRFLCWITSEEISVV